MIDSVAACNQSYSSDSLIKKEQATVIFAYLQALSNSSGGRRTEGSAEDITEGLPEILELFGIIKTLKYAMQNDLNVDKEAVKRYFYLSARVSNFIRIQIEDTGV